MENENKMIDLYSLDGVDDNNEFETSELASEYLTKVKQSFDSQSFQNFDGLVGLARREAAYYPEYRKTGKIEVNDFIEDWSLSFAEGSVVKYIARYKYKGSPIQDLKKARWYIDRLIKGMENESD